MKIFIVHLELICEHKHNLFGFRSFYMFLFYRFLVKILASIDLPGPNLDVFFIYFSFKIIKFSKYVLVIWLIKYIFFFVFGWDEQMLLFKVTKHYISTILKSFQAWEENFLFYFFFLWILSF